MRHPAGQPADGFELLRLTQLFLEPTALGDVAHEAGEDGARLGADARDGEFDGEVGAIRLQRVQLRLPAGQRPPAVVMYW